MNPYHQRQAQPAQHPLPANPYAGAAAANALRNALANPYAQQQQQFYQQQAAWGQGLYAQPTYVTAEGYTVSSTYAPSYAPPQQQYAAPMRGRGAGRGRGWHQHQHTNNTSHARPHQSSSSWSAPGSSRCTHAGCTFTGAPKSVEIHMMDRHLVFPPGYTKKRKGDWDADPSLNNGKPVPIPGTGIVLDTPEAVAAWIAERKKRFPTAQRVAEKKQQLQEAKARGDIVVADSERRASKRRRVELEGEHQHRRQDAYPGRGRGRGRGRGNARGARGAAPPRQQQQQRKATSSSSSSDSSSSDSSSSSESDSDSDMDPVRDAVSSKRPLGEPDDQAAEPEPEPASTRAAAPEPEPIPSEVSNQSQPQPSAANVKRPPPRPRQPRPPPRNPFGHRPSLLRNLLMPEIRATVSSLSQAIRFVVQNEFFDGVELRPGDAARRLRVEVVEDEDEKMPDEVDEHKHDEQTPDEQTPDEVKHDEVIEKPGEQKPDGTATSDSPSSRSQMEPNGPVAEELQNSNAAAGITQSHSQSPSDARESETAENYLELY